MHEPYHQEVAVENENETPCLVEIAPPTTCSDAYTEQVCQLQSWLNLPTVREQRRFLASHCNLLDAQSESILRDQSMQAPDGSEHAKKMREALMLLQDARNRGGTEEAVREAYINLYGGFVLDLPPWLEEVGQHLDDLLDKNQPEQTAQARLALLEETLEKVKRDADSPSEILATLHYELANAWVSHPDIDPTKALETAIHSYEEVARLYPATHYSYQYAKTQVNLGKAYWNRIMGGRRENLELAIACYQEALRIHTPDAFPRDYALAQNSLGNAYMERIAGERRENLELAIAYYREASRTYMLDAFPYGYALAQNNLGIAHRERIAGERRENQERAIAYFQEALRVHTLDAFPYQYAQAQNNLSNVYRERIAGEQRENLEQAIKCNQEALRVYTFDTFPHMYAMTQNNLGSAYGERIIGRREENLERAIAYFQGALRVWTLDAFPFYYAEIQNNLGETYQKRLIGGQRENLEQAVACYQEALRVYTTEAFPLRSRIVHLHLAETEAQRENWNAVQLAYIAALEAENLLVILGAGIQGRDAILREGRDATTRRGYALHRLGQASEAAVALERGRARGLAEAMALDAAAPTLIADEERRTRYSVAREALIATQADLHTPMPQDLDEDSQRRLGLERTAAYRHAKAAFDALIAEIRAAHDPDDFLDSSLDATTILQATEQIGTEHALVYLAATPWGGVAVAALSRPEASAARFASLDLPNLTEAWVHTLLETRLDDGSERALSGFVLAQMGGGSEQVQKQWEGETFEAKARALHVACEQTHQVSTLDQTAQDVICIPLFAHLVTVPFTSLTGEDQSLLSATFDQIFLKRELERCLAPLRTMVLHPLVSWVREQGACSLTLIPCGHLATFPLATVILSDGRSVGETLSTSVAPSARSLLHPVPTRSPQAGVYALGDPQRNLPWSEAEALTLTALARRTGLPAEAHVKQHATRERFLAALRTRWIVDASCHGTFDERDFLQSALLLAHQEQISMAEMLSHQADLRGLRLLLLSACQTALFDLQGARDEVHSLAASMLQAGAHAVLASQWAVDDQATYLLMVRFAQEWFPQMEQESPAAALARAQVWLRTVTNAELAFWQRTVQLPAGQKELVKRELASTHWSEQVAADKAKMRWQALPVRGRITRYLEDEAQLVVRLGAEEDDPLAHPFADPYFWAGFQVIGW